MAPRVPFADPINAAPVRAVMPQVATRQDLSSMNLGAPVQQVVNKAPQVMPQQPTNPFEGNEQYQALMEFQKTLMPSEEQRTRLQELQSAFEGSGAYKDYQINQLQNQLRQRRNPMMSMGLGGMRPMGMEPYQQFGRRPMPMQSPMPVPRGGYNQYNRVPMQQPNVMQNQYQQQYMNPYQQMRPQPQQFGGYGMGQQMGGYGSFGGMPNPYQPQQMGYNMNNYSGYAGNQFQRMY